LLENQDLTVHGPISTGIRGAARPMPAMNGADTMAACARMPIRPIGRILYADRDGYLPQTDCAQALPRDWRPLVDGAVGAYRSCLGDRVHSVYVRGSVARRTAVAGVSDVDMVALVVADERPDGGNARLGDFATELLRRHPIASGIELVAVPLGRFLAMPQYRSLRFAISIGGHLLCGTDVRPQLARPRLGPEAVMHAHEVAQWRQTAVRRLAAGRMAENVRQTCQWAMKRAVRSAFELVMFDVNGYTRDLYPCARAAAEEYPDKAAAIWRALDLAINPTADAAIVGRALADLTAWLHQEAVALFGATGWPSRA